VRKNPTPRRARVTISATPNANSTCSGTANASIQSVFFTAGQMFASPLKRYL
jgi:hypothetical protein